MSRIPESIVNEILSRVDIVEIVGEKLTLTPKGGRYWGLCPFHNEKTPSFSVDRDKGFYYCFGCQKGGNAASFIMELDKLSFRETLEQFAARLGIVIPEDRETRDDPRQKEIEARLELMNRIAGTFHHILVSRPEGTKAKEYVLSRAMSEETINAFQLGYAPRDRRWLRRFLGVKGYSNEFLDTTGLFIDRDRSLSFFSDRLIFPIKNAKGNVVAFGGRLLEGEGPKYLNSADSPVFKKQELLFGFDKALPAIRKQGRVLVCEGYFDTIAYHQVGIDWAVAPLGTAFTESHVKLLKRYAKEIYLAFDTDEAGQKAIQKALLLVNAMGLSARIVEFGSSKDPAEILQNDGPETLNKTVELTISSDDYLVARMGRLFDLSESSGREKAVEFLSPFFSSEDSEVRKGALLEKAARGLRTEQYALRKDLDRFSSRKNAMADPPRELGVRAKRSQDFLLLCALVIDGRCYERVRNEISLAIVDDKKAKELLIALEEAYREGEISLEAVLSRVEDEDTKNFIRNRAATGEFSTEPDALIADGIRRLKIRGMEHERESIVMRIMEFSPDTHADSLSLNDLLFDKMHIDTELAKLKGEYDERS